MSSHSTILQGLGKARVTSRRTPLRVLVADGEAEPRRALSALLAERHGPAVAFEAGDVPAAIEALLVWHPDVVVTSLGLDGHAQGGFRVLLDAVSLGIPTVVVSEPLPRALHARLDELGVAWVARGGPASAVLAAIERALNARGSSRQHAPVKAIAPATAAAPTRILTA